jgi:MoaA/NifB/PqqE/SkfB family radical SAM enzyme
MKNITGFQKFLVYVRIALHVAFKYMFRLSPIEYIRFLRRALILLLNFREHAIVRVPNGYKLQLYLPAYPSQAFFRTIESKLIRKPAGPATIVYSITKACDYKCGHCYQRNDKGSDLTEDKLIETALKIRDAGVSMFDVEGGEPFLRLERLCRLIKSLGDGVEAWVNTHGGLVDEAKLEALKKAGTFGLMISIHSPNVDEHDAFTGIAGSFEAACRAVQLCKKAGLIAAVNSVLTREQLEGGQLDKLMELTRKLDCDFVQLIHPKPAGKWLGADEQIKQNEKVIENVEAKHLLYNSGKRKDYPALAAQVSEERADSLGCTAGAIDRFYVNAAGEVQPCEFLNISFGNVNDEAFEDILKRMRSYFKEPCCDWLCCTMSAQIAGIIEKYDLKMTPVPWQYTKELVDSWDRGEATRLYRRLGIYR